MTRTEKAAFARFLSGMVSSNPETGFIFLNIVIVAAILLTFLVGVLPSRTGSPAIAWFWIIVEIVNGAGRLTWAAFGGGYAPAFTVPALLLFALSLLLMRIMRVIHNLCPRF